MAHFYEGFCRKPLMMTYTCCVAVLFPVRVTGFHISCCIFVKASVLWWMFCEMLHFEIWNLHCKMLWCLCVKCPAVFPQMFCEMSEFCKTLKCFVEILSYVVKYFDKMLCKMCLHNVYSVSIVLYCCVLWNANMFCKMLPFIKMLWCFVMCHVLWNWVL